MSGTRRAMNANLFITAKRAREAGLAGLSDHITRFRIEPTIQQHHDGSASHGYRVHLFTRAGAFAGFA